MKRLERCITTGRHVARRAGREKEGTQGGEEKMQGFRKTGIHILPHRGRDA